VTLIADQMPTFPRCPTFGFACVPQILAKVVEREGGYERVVRKWDQPLRQFNSVPLGQQSEADMHEVLKFHLALGGISTAFRFTDYTDFKSCDIGASIAPTDQPLVLEVGSPGGFQLWKRYTFGALEHLRRIYRVDGSTFRVANELGTEQDASRWTLDEGRGLLIPGGTFSGTPTSWGGEFAVKARFAQDPEFEISNYRIQRVDCQIREKREE
jgi:uncharacterized protein (TIGR02217 family)